MFVFIITVIATPTRINYPETNKKFYNYTNLFKRFFSRERQLLLLSDRPQFSDGGGPVRTLSRGSSGPAVFGRQAPPDDDSPERCCGGRSLSLRGLFKKEINKLESNRSQEFSILRIRTFLFHSSPIATHFGISV